MMMTHPEAVGPQQFLFMNVDHMHTKPEVVVFTCLRANKFLVPQVVQALPLVLKTLV